MILSFAFFALLPACAPDSGPTWIDLTCGGGHACALAKDGSVTCGGKASDGQTDPPADTKFKSISAGDTHTCGITDVGTGEGGTVACWGSNSLLESTPNLGNFIAVSAGKGFTCAIDNEHHVQCWGDKTTGVLDEKTWPTEELTALDAGESHVCAITNQQLVVCWGAEPAKSSKADPESSRPSGEDPNDPWPTEVIEIGAGRTHSCALTQDGHVWCFGLGQDNQADSQTGPFEHLAVGAQHNCALDEAGGVSCWGDNGDDESDPPVGSGPYDRISAGDEFTCAIDRDGVIGCWGNNDLDQSHPPG